MTTTESAVEPEPGAYPAVDAAPAGVTTVVTTTADTSGVGRHAAPDDSGEAGERGSLSVSDLVVEKVATAAAAQVEHVGGAARRVLGIPTGREDGGGGPRVSARVSGRVVALEVRLSVAYPASVRAVTEAVRTHVRDRVQALTDLSVHHVDIVVAALTSTEGPGSKRVVS